MADEASLHLSSQDDITDQLLMQLQERPVEVLSLSGSTLRDTDRSRMLWEKLSELSNLRRVHLSGAIAASRVAQILGSCPNLLFLEVGRAQIEADPESMHDFECALGEHRHLEEFHLMDIEVTFRGKPFYTSIDRIIKNASMIRTLKVLRIQATPHEPLHCSKFCLAPLLHSKHLEHFHLGNLPLESGHFFIIAHGVATNKSLTTLALPNCNIADVDAAKLASACSSRSSILSSLDLTNNNIGDEGCEKLAANLVRSKTIRAIKLGRNKEITIKGYTALVELLEENNNIQILEVTPTNRDARQLIKDQLGKNRASQTTASAMAA